MNFHAENTIYMFLFPPINCLSNKIIKWERPVMLPWEGVSCIISNQIFLLQNIPNYLGHSYPGNKLLQQPKISHKNDGYKYCQIGKFLYRPRHLLSVDHWNFLMEFAIKTIYSPKNGFTERITNCKAPQKRWRK